MCLNPPSGAKILEPTLEATHAVCLPTPGIWTAISSGTPNPAFGGQPSLSDELVNKLGDKRELPSLSAEKSVRINSGPKQSRTRKVS